MSAHFVSIIVPCRNEAKTIAHCLEALIGQEYPSDRYEILIVDGMSDDGTRKILSEYALRSSLIKIIDNQEKFTPFALNIGIERAKGDYIVIVGGHAVPHPDHLTKSIEYLEQYKADIVGGVLQTVPAEDTLVGRSIAYALSHPFGVGPSYFRIGLKEPRWVDTAIFGCYRKDVFARFGLFNEHLVRGQDMEFHKRVVHEGGKILLVPDIVSIYFAPSTLFSFIKHIFKNGAWAIYPFKWSYHMPISLRHLIPLGFVGSILFLSIAFFVTPFFGKIVLFLIGTYALTNLYFSGKVSLKERDIRYLLFMPVIFSALHIFYGLGSLWGICTFQFIRS